MGAGAGGGEGEEMERKKSSGMSSHGEEPAAAGVAASPGSAIGERDRMRHSLRQAGEEVESCGVMGRPAVFF